MRTLRALLAPLLLVALGVTPCAAAPLGQFGVGGGAVWPQQEFASYSDPGPFFLVRADIRIPDFPAGAGWFDLNYTQFMCEEIDTEIELGEYTFDVVQRTTQNCLAAHAGLQIGSSSQHAFFRPRVGAGLGVYHFWTAIELRQDDWPGGDEEFLRETLDSHTKLGWRGIAGADFYFAHSWGISADFVYDEVWGLERVEGDASTDETATFYGFYLGVVIAY